MVGQGFVKYALIAIGLQVEFDGFKLQTELIRAIIDDDGAKVGLSSFGAEAGEFRADYFDFVISLGAGIIKSFEWIGWVHLLFGLPVQGIKLY